MKESTTSAASLIRGTANVILAMGIAASLLLFISGVFIMLTNQGGYFLVFLGLTPPSAIVYVIVIIFWTSVIYALLCGYAVIVENSDMTAIEDALFEIADNTNTDLNKQVEQKAKEE